MYQITDFLVTRNIIKVNGVIYEILLTIDAYLFPERKPKQ